MAAWNDGKKIKNEAEFLFGELELDEVKDWYMFTLQGIWRYVAFVVRRSYMLALEMEAITGEKMQDGSSEFLTDAALFLRCEEMADEYRENGRFPRVLICDDIMIHGRNVNHIIDGLREELVRLLSDEFDKDEIQSALVDAIDIHVYIRTCKPLLLHGPYRWKLHYVKKEEPSRLHQMASDIALLVLRSNLANTCYIYTEYVSEQQMEIVRNKMRRGGFVDTTYQNTEQHAKIFYIGNSETMIKAVFSLRIIENGEQGGCRIAPLVLLPELDSRETDILFGWILQHIPEKYGKVFLKWKKLKGMRSFNEIITLLLSDSVLKSFNEAYEIIINPSDREDELIKLTRNYNQFGFDETKKMLDDLLGQDSVLNMQEVISMLKLHIISGKAMLKIAEGEAEKITWARKQELMKRVEDCFYEYGSADEISAHQLMKLPFFQTRLRSKRSAYHCAYTLGGISKGLTRRELRYCLAYFLQMIDSGVGALTLYAPNEAENDGYVQYVKAGELSLLIKPLRLYKYIAMLSRMQKECEHGLRSLTDEIKEFGKAENLEQSDIDALVDFAVILDEMGHKPDDWYGNYIERIDEKEMDAFAVIIGQRAMRNKYIEFIENRYK